MWSITKEGDPLVATSSIESHREKITGLVWLTEDLTAADASLRGSRLLSSALDGKIILWDIDLASGQSLRPAKTFLLTAENLPRSLKSRARSKAEVGITCLAVNNEDPDIIMIGENRDKYASVALETNTFNLYNILYYL